MKSTFTLSGKATLADLVKSMASVYAAEGSQHEELSNVEKAVEAKKAQHVETKANHTGNTGFGAEFVGSPEQIALLDLMIQQAPVAQRFAFRGNGLNKRDEIKVSIGLGDHFLGSEATTGYDLLLTTTGELPTANLNVDQKKLHFIVDISDEQQRFTNIVDMITFATDKMRASFANTASKAIINGDIVTAATGNVNSDDGAPAATRYYLAADGIRKVLLAGAAGATKTDIGTLSTAKMLSMYGKLGEYAADLNALTWIVDPGTYATIAALPEYLNAYSNGSNSTVNSPFLRGPLGIALTVTSAIPLTEADGKVSVTPANNTKGSIILAHRDLIQWGMNGDYMVEAFRNPGKGWKLIGTYYMGQAAVTPTTVSGLPFPLGYIGFNVTIA
jgi:hypothetical protein